MSRDFIAASSQALDGTQSTSLNAQAYPVCFHAWFNFNLTAPGLILSIRDVAAAQDPRMQITKTGEGSIQYLIKDGGGNTMAITAGPIDVLSPGNWYHVVCWSNNSTDHSLRCTDIDGSLVTSGTSAAQANWSPMDQAHIGYLANFGGVNYFDGRIAEVACWDGTLPTTGQRRAMELRYNAEHFPAGLRSSWRLMGVSSPETPNWGSDPLTLVNSPAKGVHVPGMIYPSKMQPIFPPVAAPPGGLSIPVAMNSYRQRHQSVA